MPDVILFPEPRLGGWNAEQVKAMAVAVQENKRWDLPLDSRDGREQAPSTQMLRYLTNAASLPGGKIRWGILTNGRLWRLYSQDAGSRSEGFLELDLRAILQTEKDADRGNWLRVFMMMFRRQAFRPRTELDGRTFHQYAVNEGRLWERKVTDHLSSVLLEDDGALPVLARGLARITDDDFSNPESLTKLRDAAVTILFRLLFILYAEDRRLLPVDEFPVSLREVRDKIAAQLDDFREKPFSASVTPLYDSFVTVCEIIDRGDDKLKLPPYNGGLFKNDPRLNWPKIPDDIFAPVVESLSRWKKTGGDEKERVNYRDLSVQHLGSVYEQLLEREFAFHAESGEIQIRPSPYARRTGGSYYTPESLVRLIIERAVGPLVDEKTDAFRRAVEQKSEPEKLRELDPAEAILNLKVCDPAMGSGHFLVSLVDYVADRALEAIDRAEQDAREICGVEYHSPLAEKLDDMREQIKKRLKRKLDPAQLGDRLLMRRIVLKRVVYGVDKNHLAAELAKLSLWLHTFTVGVPLPFLDHHLRDGDSLFGQPLNAALARVESGGGSELAEKVRTDAREAADLMAKVENRSDADIEQAKASADDFDRFAEKSKITGRLLSLLHSEKWIEGEEKLDNVSARLRRENKKTRTNAMNAFFSGELGEPEFALAEWKLLASQRPEDCGDAMRDIISRAAALHSREKFLHWESAFPGAWPLQNGEVPEGGFDAVIGNPPWERMKMQEVEWFEERKREIAAAETASKRAEMVRELRKQNDPLAAEYAFAARNIDIARTTARECGDYPLLSGGDLNLYSLFVERALQLVNSGGMVGLLTPSGIYADKTASQFFRKMSEAGRIAAIFDFENRTIRPPKQENGREENGNQFFPDVDSRFKFCAFVAGGAKRKFAKATGAFFLRNVEEGNNENRRVDIAPAVCALTNPNTRTAPVFRTLRDQNITMEIYRNFPVIRKHGEAPAWAVSHCAMFHMSADSRQFRLADSLSQDGYFCVDGNVFKRGEDRALPLYVGMMINHFNHRAASVMVNPENIHNPGQPKATALDQLQSAQFVPMPRYWVDENVISERLKNFPEGMEWAAGFRGVARPVDVRTMIAAIIPHAAVGNQMSLLLPNVPPRPDDDKEGKLKEWREQCAAALAQYRAEAPLYLGNLCSFALDYVCRQKMQSTALNWYIVEQLPVIPVSEYERRKFGKRTAGEIVREHVLRLTYSAEDMRPFARDMGYDGDPFVWDEEERAHLRARLDALYFHLYGIGEADAEYVMSAFPIVEGKDIKAHGRFLTRDLILEYMRALASGDSESRVTPPPVSAPKNQTAPPRPARKRKGGGRRK